MYDQNYYVYRQDVEFTRPSNTTAYAAGDAVTNNATTTVPMDFTGLARYSKGSGYIVGARLVSNEKSETTSWRVHLYNVSTATIAADNAQWVDMYADVAKKIGWITLPAMSTPADSSTSDVSRTQDFTIRIPFRSSASDQSIYAVLECLDIWTPASGTKFTLTLWADQA